MAGKRIDDNQANRSMALSIGHFGRKKLVAGGTDTYEGEAFCVVPLTQDFSYGDGCEAFLGDPPVEDELCDERFFDFWPAKVVVVKTGSAYVYLSK